jgi:hypothetical protein
MARPGKRGPEARLRELTEEHRAVAARLAGIGPVYEGSMSRQMLKCGKEACACHRDPARRHGPYAYWTTKVKGKTVSRKLSVEEADLLEEWIKNRREFDALKKKLLLLSRKMVPLALDVRASAGGT